MLTCPPSPIPALCLLAATVSLTASWDVAAEPPRDETEDPEFPIADPKATNPPREGPASTVVEEEFRATDFSFGLGYFHPVGPIGERHGHGTIMDIRLRWFLDRLVFGFEIKLMSSADSKEPIIVPAGFEGNDEPMKLSNSPSAWVMGASIHYAIVRTPSLLISLGTSLCFLKEEVEFDEEKADDGGDGKYAGLFHEYRRMRRGVATSLQLDLSYHWVFGNRLGLGPYLSVGALGGRTWNVAGVHPDLGTTDETDFGFEVWPYALLGIRAFIIERADENAAGDDIDGEMSPWFFRTLFGIGYSHPVGKIGETYPAGLEFDGLLLMRLLWFELGVDMAIRVSTRESERVFLAADSPENPHTRVWEMPSDPQSFSFALVFNPLVVDRGALSLTLGIRLGYAQHMIGRGEDVTSLEGEKYSFEDYRRLRRGIVVGERADLSWFFLRDGGSALGFAILARLDECYTWPDGTRQADTGEKDNRDYGLELWPSVSFSLVGTY